VALTVLFLIECLDIQLVVSDRGRRGRMVVGFTTTYAISTYYHLSYEFESHSWRGVHDTILCDKVCQ
jgi:hypothetical protein